MKKLLVLFFCIIPIILWSQNIAITDDENYSADTSAILDIKSTTKGVLVPRLNSTQRQNIFDPATGLLVFDADDTCFYYFTGKQWLNLSAGNASNIWSRNENSAYLTDTLFKFGVGTAYPSGKFEVKADNSLAADAPLFEVKNTQGETVFGVYPDGARVFVDEDLKGNIGGFAVSGRSATKNIQDYLLITPDSTRIYIDTASSKGNIGGFAVSGRSATKTSLNEYLQVTPNNTRVYFEKESKGNIGGFAVSGRSATKGVVEDVFLSTPDSTRVYVDSNTSKGNIGGFAVSGRSATKGVNNFLNLTPQNYFIGHEAGCQTIPGQTDGIYNSFIGYHAGLNNTSGKSNVFLGYGAGKGNTSGQHNICIGQSTGSDLGSGDYNIFIGTGSGGEYKDQSYNTCIGINAGRYTNLGNSNTFIGLNAGLNFEKGNQNTFVGADCGYGAKHWENTTKTASENAFYGFYAGHEISGGDKNVFIGNHAGYYDSTGSENVFLGYKAGYVATGSKNVFIGNKAGYNEKNSGRLYIENSNADSTGALMYGNFNNDFLCINGKLGLDTVPLDKIHVYNGNIRISNGDIIVDGTALNIPDYVFEDGYELESIEEHAEFMWKHKHLPALESAEDIKLKNGINLAERNAQLLEELEKAHIYIEELDQRIKLLEKKYEAMKEQ